MTLVFYNNDGVLSIIDWTVYILMLKQRLGPKQINLTASLEIKSELHWTLSVFVFHCIWYASWFVLSSNKIAARLLSSVWN